MSAEPDLLDVEQLESATCGATGSPGRFLPPVIVTTARVVADGIELRTAWPGSVRTCEVNGWASSRSSWALIAGSTLYVGGSPCSPCRDDRRPRRMRQPAGRRRCRKPIGFRHPASCGPPWCTGVRRSPEAVRLAARSQRATSKRVGAGCRPPVGAAPSWRRLGRWGSGGRRLVDSYVGFFDYVVVRLRRRLELLGQAPR